MPKQNIPSKVIFVSYQELKLFLMTISKFVEELNTKPKEISFEDTMKVIDSNYIFNATKFTNGNVTNEAGQNSGSCKLFSFAKLMGFNEAQTLACFGSYYQKDVLKNPAGEDHQNIRNFIRSGWEGISFEKDALTKK